MCIRGTIVVQICRHVEVLGQVSFRHLQRITGHCRCFSCSCPPVDIRYNPMASPFQYRWPTKLRTSIRVELAAVTITKTIELKLGCAKVWIDKGCGPGRRIPRLESSAANYITDKTRR